MTPRAARALALFALTALLAIAATAGAATVPLRFDFLPKRAVQGSSASISVAVRRASDRCSLSIRYANGAPVAVGAVATRGGRASWSWLVPKDARPGAARASVSCAHSGRVAGSLVVVGAVLPPKIDVVNQGFSVKTPKTGGASASFGVVLHNQSASEDALNISVLVNFVLADNVLIGTTTLQVAKISAGSDYNLGGSLSFPGAAPVARLEITAQVGGHAKHVQPTTPSLANLRLLPGLYDPSMLGSLEGELINDHPTLNFRRATLSAVVFDDAGNVVGGGSGMVSGPLPPGSREFFKASAALTAIPMTKAASVRVSVDPTYDTPGS
jgi:hypothetical protein